MENQPQPAQIPQPELQEPQVPNVVMSISDQKMRDADSGKFVSPEVWNQYETQKSAFDTQETTKAEIDQKEAEKTSLFEKLSALPEGTEHEKHATSAISEKAGVSWKQAYEMGSTGFSDLVKEARDWKAEQTPKETELTPAEKRQSEYAGLLKAHDKETLAAATRVAERKEAEATAMPEAETEVKTPEPLKVPAIELPAITPEPKQPGKELMPLWNQEIAKLPSKELIPAASTELAIPESDNLPVLWRGSTELEPIEEGEPADQGDWLRRGFNRAKNAVMLAPVNIPRRVGEWARRNFTEQGDNGERQTRRGKVALAVGGLAVAVGGVYLASKGIGGGETVMAGPQPGSGNGTGGEVAAQALGWTDTINPGDGLTNSIMDYAQQHGVNVEPQRAFDIFNQLNAEHLIDPSHVTGTTPMEVMGNVGYVAPGQSVWSPETVARMHELLGL